MNTETMTVHKALAELKVLDSRISNAITSGSYITTKKNNQDKISGKSADEFKELAKASYDKASDLIKRRNAIKRAVTLSNAKTEVEIGGERMTVVEAIDMKNHGMEHYIQLRDMLTLQLGKAKTALEKNNDSLQSKAEAFVTGLNAGGEVKKGSEEYTSTMNNYIKANTMELIDPLAVEKKIAELDDKINAFMPEVDAALSVSNATTTIEIEY